MIIMGDPFESVIIQMDEDDDERNDCDKLEETLFKDKSPTTIDDVLDEPEEGEILCDDTDEHIEKSPEKPFAFHITPPNFDQIPNVYDISGVFRFLTKEKIMSDINRCVAIWSNDSNTGAIDIIPLVAQFGYLEELKDQWTSGQLSRWMGVVVTFSDKNAACVAAQELPSLKIGDKWPIKAVNIGHWLKKLTVIEEHINSTPLKYYHTNLHISNFNSSVMSDLLKSMKAFGLVISLTPFIGDSNQSSFFEVKYLNAVDAYTAQWYLHGRDTGGNKLKVSIVSSPKIEAIEKQIRNNDMVIWNKS